MVMSVFTLADGQGRRFVQKTGLICPENCGECCRSKNIHVTILECIPVSLHLWKEGKGDQIYDLFENNVHQKECFFFQENLDENLKGHCSIYPYRFLVCRLFSNSVRRDADGKFQLQTCKLIKQQRAAEFQQAKLRFEQKTKAPVASDFGFRLFAIDPYLGKELLPLNLALKKALEITCRRPRTYSRSG